MSEVFERYVDEKRMWNLEGESGVRKLETLVEDLGYGQGFMSGRAIEEFLADNQGAMEAVVNFIGAWVERNTEWQKNLRNACEDSEEAVSDLD